MRVDHFFGFARLWLALGLCWAAGAWGAVPVSIATREEAFSENGRFSAQIRAEDRWAIVAYIRALQLSEHATLTDVPAADRSRIQ